MRILWQCESAGLRMPSGVVCVGEPDVVLRVVVIVEEMGWMLSNDSIWLSLSHLAYCLP